MRNNLEYNLLPTTTAQHTQGNTHRLRISYTFLGTIHTLRRSHHSNSTGSLQTSSHLTQHHNTPCARTLVPPMERTCRRISQKTLRNTRHAAHAHRQQLSTTLSTTTNRNNATTNRPPAHLLDHHPALTRRTCIPRLQFKWSDVQVQPLPRNNPTLH